jgi:hypothetical protein
MDDYDDRPGNPLAGLLLLLAAPVIFGQLDLFLWYKLPWKSYRS